jgi:hypothetical protein
MADFVIIERTARVKKGGVRRVFMYGDVRTDS